MSENPSTQIYSYIPAVKGDHAGDPTRQSIQPMMPVRTDAMHSFSDEVIRAYRRMILDFDTMCEFRRNGRSADGIAIFFVAS